MKPLKLPAGLATDTAWLLADRLFRAVVQTAVGVLIARCLGLSGFGQFALVLAAVAMAQGISSWGLETILPRMVLARPDRAPPLIVAAVILRFSTGLASAFLLLATGPWWGIDPDQRHLIALAAISVPLAAGEVFDQWLQAQRRFRASVLFRLPPFVVGSALRCALALGGARVDEFILLSALESAAIAVALGIAVGKDFRDGLARFGEALRDIRPLAAQGWALSLSNAGISVYMRVPYLVLGIASGEAAVGLLAVAQRLVEPWYLVLGAIVSAVQPRLLACPHGDAARYNHALARILGHMAWICYGMAAITALAAWPVIVLLFGPAFADAVPVALIMTLTIHPVAFGMVRSVHLAYHSLTHLHPLSIAFAGIVCIGVSAVAVPWGALGAAAAIVAGQMVAAIGSNLILTPLRPFLRMEGRALVTRP